MKQAIHPSTPLTTHSETITLTPVDKLELRSSERRLFGIEPTTSVTAGAVAPPGVLSSSDISDLTNV